MSDVTTIRLGVIGVGYRFPLALRAHKPTEGVSLVAAADCEPSALKRFRDQIGHDCSVYSTACEMIDTESLDAVFVMTPDGLHETHAVMALKAGLDVFLEKPMAITMEQCDRILETARVHQAKLYVGHNMRHMQFVRIMKNVIDEGKIGKVKAAWGRHFISSGGDSYFKDWHADRSYTNSLLVHKGCHDIDVLQWLCGSRAEWVHAMGNLSVFNQVTDIDQNPVAGKMDRARDHWPPLDLKGRNPVVDVEDLSMMQMRLENGVLVSYQQCHYSPDNWRNFTIIGTEGRMENFGDRGEAGATIRVWNKKTYYSAEPDLEYPIPADNRQADAEMIAEFITYLRGGTCSPLTSPLGARDSVATTDMATKSLRTGGQPINVPPASPELMDYFSNSN